MTPDTPGTQKRGGKGAGGVANPTAFHLPALSFLQIKHPPSPNLNHGLNDSESLADGEITGLWMIPAPKNLVFSWKGRTLSLVCCSSCSVCSCICARLRASFAWPAREGSDRQHPPSPTLSVPFFPPFVTHGTRPAPAPPWPPAPGPWGRSCSICPWAGAAPRFLPQRPRCPPGLEAGRSRPRPHHRLLLLLPLGPRRG